MESGNKNNKTLKEHMAIGNTHRVKAKLLEYILKLIKKNAKLYPK